MSAPTSAPTTEGAPPVQEMRISADAIADRLGAHRPTAEQRAVIEAPLEPTLVVAGAGSGKTATMADRVVFLVANGWVRPDEILGVTFTRKAAGELRERITGQLKRLVGAELIDPPDLMPEETDQGEVQAVDGLLPPAISTYHSYANTLVSEYGLNIGLEPETQLIGEAQAWQIVSELVRGYDRGETLVEAGAKASTLADGVLQLTSDCAEHLVEPQQVAAHLDAELQRVERLIQAGTKKPNDGQQKLIDALRLRRETAELAQRYQRAKLEGDVMDYGDLLRFAARIAVEVPSAGESERQKYRVVLLDEFQDTSYAQLELFSSLFGAGASASGIGHAVTAVGDPNQSIYGFRGASAGQLFDFPQKFPRTDPVTGERSPAQTRQLTIAWRNGRHILDMANRLVLPFAQNAEHPEKSWHRSTAHLRRQLQPLITPDKGGVLPESAVQDGTVQYGWFATEQEEARAVAGQIAAVMNAEEREQTYAVLARTRAQLETAAAALRRAGVPCEFVGLSGLLSTPEVAEVLAYLRVIADPKRSDALLRILGGARYRIGPRDLYALGRAAKGLESWRRKETVPVAEAGQTDDAEDRFSDFAQELEEMASLVEALDALPDGPKRAAERWGFTEEGAARLLSARDGLRTLRQSSSLDLGTLIQRVVTETGLEVEVAARPWEEQHHATRQLDALVEQAESFTSTEGRADLSSFLEWLEAAEKKERGLEQAQADPRPGAVQLLTVHASKGLEWDVVAVLGMREGKFPSKQADRWTTNNGQLPWPLRGDAASLPQWDSDQETLQFWACAAGVGSSKEYEGSIFKADCEEFSREEERRMAYVAVTRAKRRLICTGACFYGTAGGEEPSEFLEEIREQAAGFDGEAGELNWAEVEDKKTNPLKDRLVAAQWPFDPLEPLPTTTYEVRKADPEDPRSVDEWVEVPEEESGAQIGRRVPMHRAAQLVRAELERMEKGSEEVAGPYDSGAEPTWQQEAEWVIRRARRQQAGLEPPKLPAHMSASRFVSLARDAEEVAEQTRRPVPRRPSAEARRGTVVHSWVEEYYETRAAFPEIEEPLRGDQELDVVFDLPRARENFGGSRWAQRQIFAMEIPIETSVEGVMLRGRIDAVFGSHPDGSDVDSAAHERWETLTREERNRRMQECSWQLVDWKTGRVPQGQELRTKQLQLAIYRLAFSRLYEIPLDQIEASFFYIDHGVDLPAENLPSQEELEGIIAEAQRHFG